jgi:hypothetical protein
MITAELFARAIIAASVSLGEINATQMRSKLITANAYLPASVAVALEVKQALTEVVRIVGVDCDAVALARRADLPRFKAAQDAARDAIRYHLKAKAEKAAREAPAPVPAVIQPEPASEPPAARLAPVLTRPKSRSRAMPKGVRFESLGNGVQVIRLKPITDSIARHAQQQIAKGADIEEVADLFEVSADSLRARIEGMKP